MQYQVIRIFICSFLLSFTLQGYSQSTFQIHYATNWGDHLNAADTDSYGNVIFVGGSGISGTPSYSFVMKVYPNGCTRIVNISSPDTSVALHSIKVLPTGNYFIVGGKTGYPIVEAGEMMVLILDTALNILSSKYYAIPIPYLWNGSNCSMIIDNSGNLVLATNLCYYENTILRYDFAFYKFTQQGDTILSRIYHTLFHADPYCLRKILNSDNLMLISHGYLPYTTGELLFLDENLNILKATRIRTDGLGYFDSKYWLSDTTFLMVEDYIEHTDTTREYMFRVSRLDTSATYYEGINLNRPDTIEYVSQWEGMSCYNDTTIYVCGYQCYNDLSTSTPSKVFLYIIDKDMNLRGYKALGGDNYYNSTGVQATIDGGCMVWAYRWDVPYSGNSYDVQIWKVMPDDMTLYTQVEYLPPERLQTAVWPNPAHDDLYLGLTGFAVNETVRFRIFDISGQKYLDQALTVSGNTIHTNIRNLDAGVYIYEVENIFGKKNTGKFIKN